jgi:hypothetical protein
MTTIFWADEEYGIRRRVAGPVLAVLALAVVTLALTSAATALATAPGGLTPPPAPPAPDTAPVAWTPAPWAPPAADGTPAPAPPTPPAAPPTTPADQLHAALASLPPIASASGATVRIGDAPMAPGHWGVYEPTTNVVYAGHGAFADGRRLQYVVAHELAHAYYFKVATDEQRAALDAATEGGPAVRGGTMELTADCIALIWGATTSHYWSCPQPYRSVVASLVPAA